MNKLIAVLFLVPGLAFASTYEVSCGVNKQPTQGGYKLSASVKGTVTGTAADGYTLGDYTVSYTVWTDGDVWGEETITGDELENDARYNPREYADHVRFTLPSKQGKVELIYPGTLGNRKKFKAHLVLTHINDHFGGTAHVYCSKTRSN